MTVLIAAGNFEEAKRMAFTYCMPSNSWKYIECVSILNSFNKTKDVIWLAKNWKRHPDAYFIQKTIDSEPGSVQKPRFHST